MEIRGNTFHIFRQTQSNASYAFMQLQSSTIFHNAQQVTLFALLIHISAVLHVTSCWSLILGAPFHLCTNDRIVKYLMFKELVSLSLQYTYCIQNN